MMMCRFIKQQTHPSSGDGDNAGACANMETGDIQEMSVPLPHFHCEKKIHIYPKSHTSYHLNYYQPNSSHFHRFNKL